MAFFAYYRGGVSSAIAEESLEYTLASYVGKNDIFVARFCSLLRQLSVKYVKNRQQITAMTATAQQMLREDGRRWTQHNMMAV